MRKGRITRGVLTAAGVLAGGVAVLARRSYRRDIARARARVSFGNHILKTPCGPIEYAESGEGRPVLVIHGAGGGFDQGLHLGRTLIAEGFRVIAPSRFGYLGTPLPPDASPMAQADAHACLLDALNVPKVAVLGASAGGPSAMQFALRHPERCSALILIAPLAFRPQSENRPQHQPSPFATFVIDTTLRSDFLFWTAIKLGRDILIETILATPMADFRKAAPDDQEWLLQLLWEILPISGRRQGLRNEATIAASLPRYALEQIAAPTLAVSAKNDGYGTFDGTRYTAGHIPGARFIGYSSGGHLLVGHQDEVRSEIAEFLDRIAGGKPSGEW